MTIVIPDARTPSGVKCWVREFDGYDWLPRVYAGCGQDQYRVRTDGIGQEHWRLCRLDDPETGWVENTGAQHLTRRGRLNSSFGLVLSQALVVLVQRLACDGASIALVQTSPTGATHEKQRSNR